MFCDHFHRICALKWDLRVLNETFEDWVAVQREMSQEVVAPMEATLEFEEDVIRCASERQREGDGGRERSKRGRERMKGIADRS
jgi:hypothetical protein